MIVQAEKNLNTTDLIRNFYGWVLSQTHQLTKTLLDLRIENATEIGDKAYDLETKITRQGLRTTLIMLYSTEDKKLNKQEVKKIEQKIIQIKQEYFQLHKNVEQLNNNLEWLLDSMNLLKKDVFEIVGVTK